MTTRTQLPLPLIWLLGLVTGVCLPVIGFAAWCAYVGLRRDTGKRWTP